MNKPLILAVEDDTAVRNLITTTLETQDYRFHTAANGAQAILEAASQKPDIMLLDLGLPDMDGVEVIKKIRSWSNLPIIVISARSEDRDKIEALDAGADDYLTKPFAMAELLARLRAMTRRSTAFTPQKLQTGSVSVDVAEQELCSTNAVRLSAKETKLMQLLMLNADKDLTTGEILSRVWPDEEEDEKIVWIYISYLKEKLAAIDADVTITGGEGGPFRLVPEA